MHTFLTMGCGGNGKAMDRAHRIGQKKVVNVYRLITKNTLEEKVLSLSLSLSLSLFFFRSFSGRGEEVGGRLSGCVCYRTLLYFVYAPVSSYVQASQESCPGPVAGSPRAFSRWHTHAHAHTCADHGSAALQAQYCQQCRKRRQCLPQEHGLCLILLSPAGSQREHAIVYLPARIRARMYTMRRITMNAHTYTHIL